MRAGVTAPQRANTSAAKILRPAARRQIGMKLPPNRLLSARDKYGTTKDGKFAIVLPMYQAANRVHKHKNNVMQPRMVKQSI